MITAAEREFALELLDRTRDGLLRMLRGLSDEQLLYRPEPGRWSVAENVEHVIVVENRLVRAMDKLLKTTPDFTKRPAMDDQEVIRQISTVADRVQSPEHSLPKLRWPAGELSREFESARGRTRDFVSATEGDLRHYFMEHFKFGEFDAFQWMLLIGAHSTRHTLQSESVKHSPHFPVTAG